MNRNIDVGLKLAILLVIGVTALFTSQRGESAGQDGKMPIARIAADNVVKLEVAATAKEIEHGLMYRTSLPEDQGMVFLFHPARAVNFWMYHTKIPLDMLFVKNGKIVKIFENVPPCTSEDPSQCPTYPQGPGLDVSEVIEVQGGYAKKHKVKEGDPVTFELPDLGKTPS
jgi:uncharacterized protein